MNAFLLTAGLSVVLQSVYRLVFGNCYRGITQYWHATFHIFGMTVAADRVMAFVIAWVAIAGMWFFLQRTRTGRAIRAVSQDERGAMLVGIKWYVAHSGNDLLSSRVERHLPEGHHLINKLRGKKNENC